MTELDHTSVEALVADLNRNKGGMFVCSRPDGSSPSEPWWLVSVVVDADKYNIHICVRYSDDGGTSRSGTSDEDRFLLSGGALRFPSSFGFWVIVVHDDADASLNDQLNNNLRRVFA